MIWLDDVQFWHWWILAAILATIEIVAPGVFFIWLGVAAVITGFVALIVPSLGWEIEAVIFAVLSVLTIIAWRGYQKKTQKDEPASTLNRRGEQMIGRLAVLSEPIVNGRGKAKLDDTVWRVEGPDLSAGTRVTVTGIDGAILKVEAAR